VLEVLTRVLDLLIRGGTAFQKRREKERRDEFGKAMLQCYLRITEVVATAKLIITELEYFVERAERYRERAEVFDHGTYNLQVLCNKQGYNLDRLAGAVRSIAPQIAVFSSDAGWQLEALVRGKMHTLWILTNLIGTGHYYVGPEDELLAAGDRGDWRLRYGALQNSSLFLADEWNLGNAPRVVAYLRDGHPSDHLKGLESSARELREFIVKNFSLDQILISIAEVHEAPHLIFEEDVVRSKMFLLRNRPSWRPNRQSEHLGQLLSMVVLLRLDMLPELTRRPLRSA
jgi:hypothetical protein